MVTSLVIVISGLWNTGLNGATLTVAAFDSLLPGNIGAAIVVSSVILFGSVNRVTCRVLWLSTILLGSQTTLGLVWSLANTVNGMMIIPNLIGILLLSNEVVKLKKEYFKSKM